MKLKRIRKNMLYSFMFGCSNKRFKKSVISSPDGNIKRVPARKLKAMMVKLRSILNKPEGVDRYHEVIKFRKFG